MTGNTTPAEKLRSLFLVTLMVFSVFGGTIAFTGGAAAATAGNSGSFIVPDTVQEQTTNDHNITLNATDVDTSGNGNQDFVVDLPNALTLGSSSITNVQVNDGAVTAGSTNVNTTSNVVTLTLQDNTSAPGSTTSDVVNVTYTLTNVQTPNVSSNVSAPADFGVDANADGDFNDTADDAPSQFETLNIIASTGGGGNPSVSASGFNAPLPQNVTDNTPNGTASPGTTQVITNLSFGTPGMIENVTVNATGGLNGSVSASSIDEIAVQLSNSSGLLNSSSVSYDSHNTTVNVSAMNVTDLVVLANVSGSSGQIDASLTAEAGNLTGVADTAGIQTLTGQTGFISGRVSDQNNNDVQNATVEVRNASSGFLKTTQTNSEGDYTIEVPPGNYTVTADKVGFASAPPKDKGVQDNSTTTANLVIRRILFPDDITVTPPSDTTFVETTQNYTVTVFDQNGSVLDNVDVEATSSNPDVTFNTSTTLQTDDNGTATFTVYSDDIATSTLNFTAINNSGQDPSVEATANFIPRSGNGTVFGEVYEVGNDDRGLENATVYAVNKNRFGQNSIAVPVPSNIGDTQFYRVVNNDTGEIVDYDDYRVDNNGQNAALTWAVIREHNTTDESFGSGFAVRIKQAAPGPVYVTPLEAGNYTVEASTNQPNASDERFADTSGPTTNFTTLVNETQVVQNLTDQNAEELAGLSGSQLIDTTDDEGKYLLDYLYADGQEGVDYTLIAEKPGYERDYVDALVTADGAFFELGKDENFDLRPREIEAGAVNITQIGTHPVTGYNTSLIDEFENKSDEYVQNVSRNGSVIDVVEVETLTDDGVRINGTAEVSIEDAAAFGGRWLNTSVIGGTEVNYSPSVDQITVNTGSDGVARVLLLADISTVDLVTNKTAVLTNDRSATDNSTVRFVGQINFRGAAISGIVTDTNDDPVQDSIAYTESFVFPAEASLANPGINFNRTNQTRFTISPDGGVAASQVDDDSDQFIVTSQDWNKTSGMWEDQVSAAVTRSELRSYSFPKSDFPGVSVNISSADGFKLVDIVQLTGSADDPDASYTLDPVPAVNTETSAPSTEYSVRAVKLDDPNASATRFGQAAVQPGSTDDANIVLPINVTSANLDVTSLDAPSSATVGSTVTVNASITNTGGSLGQTQDVTFSFGGTVVDNETVTVTPGDTVTVTFSAPTAGLAAGTYDHTVATGDDSQTETIELTESSDFQVSGLSAPASAVQGDTVNVSATVTNNGSSTATQTVEFRAGGAVVDSTSLTLSAGGSDTVMFTLDTSSLAPGNYTHGVYTDDDNETAMIEILSPAVFEITSTSVPANVTQGDTLNVSATITNTGGAAGSDSVSFELNGTNVSAGGSGAVDIVFAFDDTGSMGDEIDGLQENVVNFTNAVEASGADARYALVSFNDSVGVDQDYTDDVSTLQTAVNDLTALGGGSFAENGYGAISEAANLSSRSGAQKIIVHITDASSHYEGDGSFESFSPVINESDLAARLNAEGTTVITVGDESPTTDARANTTRWTLEDIDDGEWIDLDSDDFGDILEGRLADLITSRVSGTNTTLAAGDSTSVAFSIDTSRLAPGTYDALFSTSDDMSSDSVEVEEGGTSSCDLSSLVQSYDADSDCAISLTELGQASADFANGDITLTQLGQVSTAFANTADT